MSGVVVTSAMVIRALHYCYDANGREPSPVDELARYLSVDEDAVRIVLLELQKKRLARAKTRKGQRVWEPWL